MKIRSKVITIISTTLLALNIADYSNLSPTHSNFLHNFNVAVVSAHSSKLANLNYRPGSKPYIFIHHDKSTLSPHSWHYDHVHYSNLDHENRTSRHNTGYLKKKNLAHDSLRVRQIFEPTGWHQKFIHHEAIINRGHEIAYSLSKGISQSGRYNPSAKSGDQNNPKNLFTETAFSNQRLQTKYEGLVRQALRKGEHVIYQVRPIFHKRNKMAKGVHLQAISTNRKLNFNVYLFNVQPGIKFNYANGRSRIDHAMRIPGVRAVSHYKYHRKYRRHDVKRHYVRRHHHKRRYVRKCRSHHRRTYRHRRHYHRHSSVRHYRKPAWMYKRHYRRAYYEN